MTTAGQVLKTLPLTVQAMSWLKTPPRKVEKEGALTQLHYL